MEYFEDKESGVVVVALRYGDGLLESIREVAKLADIHTGVVTSGIGSLRKGHIHTVVSNTYPPTDEFIRLEGPLEIAQFGGIIADYQPHLHINLMKLDRSYIGGHIEDGCEILALSEISILKLKGLRLQRQKVDETSIAHLRPLR
jgi:predicted DNA-binding protein with PD1-like motif